MKYLCLGYHEQQVWNAMKPAERESLQNANDQYQALLRDGGQFLEGIALESTGATLRFDHANPVISDGPFAETKEQLGGVMLLEARDLNHAIQLMSQLPCMRVGGRVEIRPVNETLSDLPTSARIHANND